MRRHVLFSAVLILLSLGGVMPPPIAWGAGVDTPAYREYQEYPEYHDDYGGIDCTGGRRTTPPTGSPFTRAGNARSAVSTSGAPATIGATTLGGEPARGGEGHR